MDGHGNLNASTPFLLFSSNSFPFSSRRTGKIPTSGLVAKVGFSFVTFAIEDIIIPPVSVCHHVSTIGHLLLPIFSLYQFHASSFIGSPTVPRTFNEVRSYLLTKSIDCLANALIAVGAV